MKTKDIPALEIRVLGMLPNTQAEICKSLGIGHRDCSTLVKIMVNENLIGKKRFKTTFLLEKINGSKKKEESKEKELSFPLLSKDGKFSPCIGCEKDCDPNICEPLAEWLK